MALIYALTFALAVFLSGMQEAQSLTRRSWSSCNYDDLNVLLTLARALDETENARLSCRNNIDVEEIIMKLINALVYTTVSNTKNGSGGGNRSSDEALIDLDLLNPNDPDNILKLDLAKQKLLGLGLGNKNTD
ncbi:PREDICTED: uncharacterized protein LOC106111110 [Papilio polytes]|uniref:uncharacterized protein LOC106111110 n=1 Tax=Papilio polytes TaxID=76194 RepID=UPI000675D750|nr:PREDICTED: uncharacterized protein LOC106111110 [Papilio polytes]